MYKCGRVGKLRAQPRAEAEDAEMKILTSKDGRRALLIKLRNPWIPLSAVGGLMGAGGAPSSTNPQPKW